MTTLAHLSDLHFGREDLRAVDALREHLTREPVDAVIVSGDLTQRARSQQFKDAMAFLRALPGEKLIVPGNHDVPLWDVWERFTRPLDRYKRYVTTELMPILPVGNACVVGVQSASRGSTRWNGFWKDGVIRKKRVKAVTLAWERHADAAFRVVTTHHPLRVEHDTAGHAGDVVRGQREALEAFASSKVDLVLYGHIHVPHAEIVREAGRAIILVMAGTSTSSRHRAGHTNSYNRIRLNDDACQIDVMVLDGDRFVPQQKHRFERDPEMGWSRTKSVEVPTAPTPA